MDQTAQILAILIVQFGQVGVIARYHVVAVTKLKLETVLFQLYLDRLQLYLDLDRLLVRFQILPLAQQNLVKIAQPTAPIGHHGVIVRHLVGLDIEHVIDTVQIM